MHRFPDCDWREKLIDIELRLSVVSFISFFGQVVLTSRALRELEIFQVVTSTTCAGFLAFRHSRPLIVPQSQFLLSLRRDRR